MLLEAQIVFNNLKITPDVIAEMKANFLADHHEPLSHWNIYYQWESGVWKDTHHTYVSPATMMRALGLTPHQYWKWVARQIGQL